MSDSRNAAGTVALKRKEADGEDSRKSPDSESMHRMFKTSSIVFIVGFVVFMAAIITSSVYYIDTTGKIKEQYERDVKNIIITKSNIEATNAWERIPIAERKEKLRMQYYEIVRYYSNDSPIDKRMTDEMILESFNKLWATTSRVPHVNFFLPVAYMKVVSNFNPKYDVDYKRGIAGILNKTGERMSNLKLVREDPAFQLSYRGIETLESPIDSISLLVARIDDLMITFNNRIDWVILSMYTNEYDVIEKYWQDGDGAIPDQFYKSGEMAETLGYFNAFKNWQIPVN